MTKLHKTTALLLLATMFLTGCAECKPNPAPGTNTSSDISDSTYTEPENSTSYDNTESSNDSGIKSNFKTLVDNFPAENITMPDGSVVSKYEVIGAKNENNTYQLDFGFSFFRYAEAPLYTTLDDPSLLEYETHIELNNSHNVTPSKYFKVKTGDKLGNGLVVKSTTHSVIPFDEYDRPEEETLILESGIEFEGRLTLSGILYCHSGANRAWDNGSLFFFVDPAHSDLLPLSPGTEMFGYLSDYTDKFAAACDAPQICLGNINDLPGDFPDIITPGGTAKVRIIVENISTSYYNTVGRVVDFTLVSIEPL